MTQPQTEMVELEPCPFCATEMHPHEHCFSHPKPSRGDCIIRHYSFDNSNAEEWNRRTIAPDIEELVGALRAISDESVFNQLRFAGEDDTDYFLRCFRAVKERASATLSKFTNTKGNDRG